MATLDLMKCFFPPLNSDPPKPDPAVVEEPQLSFSFYLSILLLTEIIEGDRECFSFHDLNSQHTIHQLMIISRWVE